MKINRAATTGFLLCFTAIIFGVLTNGGFWSILNLIHIPSFIITFNQLFGVYMKLKNDLRPSTRVNYEKRWAYSIENSVLGKKRICDIKQIHVKVFYNACV